MNRQRRDYFNYSKVILQIMNHFEDCKMIQGFKIYNYGITRNRPGLFINDIKDEFNSSSILCLSSTLIIHILYLRWQLLHIQLPVMTHTFEGYMTCVSNPKVVLVSIILRWPLKGSVPVLDENTLFVVLSKYILMSFFSLYTHSTYLSLVSIIQITSKRRTFIFIPHSQVSRGIVVDRWRKTNTTEVS